MIAAVTVRSAGRRVASRSGDSPLHDLGSYLARTRLPCRRCSFRTRSGRGGFSIAVELVPTSPPNSGIMQVVPAGCSPRVSTSRI